MGKTVFVAEKPSVAQEFAKALGLSFQRRDGYLAAENTYITWCVGHLVGMSYPDAYDAALKKWSLSTIPFIPDTYRYEVLPGTGKQYAVVAKLLTDPEVDTIYVCTDSGREGEYIYRLVAMQAGVTGKKEYRVWIDSQTTEEIRRGIKEAKEERSYDTLSDAAYLRAQEDYLMGINFSRAMTLKYADLLKRELGRERCVIAVGRVMTCVLGMVVAREREIRAFTKTPFYRVAGAFGSPAIEALWTVSEESRYAGSPLLYGEKGFRRREDAQALIDALTAVREATVTQLQKKKEKKNPPLLYNLAELQNDCARFFKISPDETLAVAQTLYEKKLTTYPRTDARVLSTAVAKEITKTLNGLYRLPDVADLVKEIAALGSAEKLVKSRYVNDKAITDHYAIIPTGQGLEALGRLDATTRRVYELIVRRFLSIFFPPAVYEKTGIRILTGEETFASSFRVRVEEGYQKVLQYSFGKKDGDKTVRAVKTDQTEAEENDRPEEAGAEEAEETEVSADVLQEALRGVRKGSTLSVGDFVIKEGETSPPKRYNSGSMILAMENAGQLIEEEELREQIKGSGIGTSATRAEIIKKLVANDYLSLHKKTQILTPTRLGEMIYDTVAFSARSLLDPKLTASWEMGLTRVVEGSVTKEEYRKKLEQYVRSRVEHIKTTDFRGDLLHRFRQTEGFYKGPSKTSRKQTGQKSKAKQ